MGKWCSDIRRHALLLLAHRGRARAEKGESQGYATWQSGVDKIFVTRGLKGKERFGSFLRFKRRHAAPTSSTRRRFGLGMGSTSWLR